MTLGELMRKLMELKEQFPGEIHDGTPVEISFGALFVDDIDDVKFERPEKEGATGRILVQDGSQMERPPIA